MAYPEAPIKKFDKMGLLESVGAVGSAALVNKRALLAPTASGSVCRTTADGVAAVTVWADTKPNRVTLSPTMTTLIDL
jgi:hypothetical protein